MEFENDLESEKQEFFANQNKKSESYQTILNQISDLRTKIRDLQGREASFSKD